MLLLVTSVIVSTSTGIESVTLGQGKMNKAFNLDMGSKQSSVSPHFGMNGFASPLISQPMELDPGAMVTQSERLRDQSQSLRDQSEVIYNDTAALMDKTSAFAEQVEKDCLAVKSLKEDASHSANSSLRSSLSAGDYFNDTRAVYGDTRTLYNWTQVSEEKVEIATIMNLAGAINSVGRYDKVPADMNDIASLKQQVMILSEKMGTLERKVSELENMTKTK